MNPYTGFRPGDSFTNHLLFLANEIHEAFNDVYYVEARSVFLDMPTAFDKVFKLKWHKANGIRGQLLSLLTNYLGRREQRVVIKYLIGYIKHLEFHRI